MPGGKGNIKSTDGKPFTNNDDRINRDGRPKKLPALDALMADVLCEEKGGISAAKTILMAMRLKASRGDVRAAELLLDRAYGKLKQSNDISLDFDSMTEGQLDILMTQLLRKLSNDTPD